MLFAIKLGCGRTTTFCCVAVGVDDVVGNDVESSEDDVVAVADDGGVCCDRGVAMGAG